MFSSPGSVLAMRDLAQPRRQHLGNPEARDVAVEFVESLDAPRAHQSGQPALRDAVAVLQHRAHALGVEQPERAFEHRAQLVAGLQHIDGMHFHQCLQPFGERRLAAADRAKQVHDLLALFETLRGVAQEADDALDRLFHAVEFGERRIDPHRAVHEDAAESRVLRGIDHLRFADRGEQALGRGRVHHRIVAARFQILWKRHLRFAVRLEASGVGCEQVIDRIHRPLRQLGGQLWH